MRSFPSLFYKMRISVDNKIYLSCISVVARCLAGKLKDNTNGSTHYHVKDLQPAWSAGEEPEVIIENHVFYTGIA